jgi:hypothetical protein
MGRCWLCCAGFHRKWPSEIENVHVSSKNGDAFLRVTRLPHDNMHNLVICMFLNGCCFLKL